MGRLTRWLTLAALLAAGTAEAANPVASLALSNGASNNYPLLVWFDATGSTDADVTRPFHHLLYCFNSGDGNGATYSVPTHYNAPKATFCGGPNFAYVYETPGTYTASVWAIDEQGNQDEATVSITVNDWADADQVCIRPAVGGDFTGCPAGATQWTAGTNCTTDDYDACVASAVAAGFDQILFQGGKSFAVSATVPIGPTKDLGAYGTGNVSVTTGTPDPLINVNGDDVRVRRITYTGNGAGNFASIDQGAADSDFILFQTHTLSTTARILSTTGFNQPSKGAGFSPPDVIGLSEIAADDCGNSGGNCLYLSIRRLALMGSKFNDATGGEHIVRFEHVGESAAGRGGSFVYNTRLERAAAQKHLLTIRGSPPESGSCSWGGDFWSERHVVAYNHFIADTNWALQTGAGNGCGTPNTITQRDTIIEGNLFTLDPAPVETVLIAVKNQQTGTNQDLTQRNNMVNFATAGAGGAAFSNAFLNFETFNNSVHADNTQSFYESASGTGCVVRNNLLQDSGGTACFFEGSACATQSDNWDTDGTATCTDTGVGNLTAVPWATNPPTVPTHFQIVGGDPDGLVNGGTSVPNKADAQQRIRPVTSWDVGCWEKDAVAFSPLGGGGGGGGAAKTIVVSKVGKPVLPPGFEHWQRKIEAWARIGSWARP